jgi:hypothetical protein
VQLVARHEEVGEVCKLVLDLLNARGKLAVYGFDAMKA